MMNFEALSISQTLGRVLAVFWSHKRTFWKIAACVVVPSLILQASLQAILVHVLADVLPPQGDSLALLMDILSKIETEQPPIVVLLTLVYWMVSTALHAIGGGAMIRVVAEAHLERDGGVWVANYHLKIAARHFGSLFCARFLKAGGGVLAFLLPLILIPTASWLGLVLLEFASIIVLYLRMRLGMVAAAIVVEQTSSTSGISRSWSLSEGALCYVFGSSFILMVLQAAAIFGGLYMAVGGAHAFQPTGIILGALLQQLPNFVLLPCHAILQTSLYFSRRIETEQFTKDDLARELFSSGSSEGDRDMASPLLSEETEEIL